MFDVRLIGFLALTVFGAVILNRRFEAVDNVFVNSLHGFTETVGTQNQAVSGQNSSTRIALTFASKTKLGSTIIALIAFGSNQNGSGNQATVTDNNNNTWTYDGRFGSSTFAEGCMIASCTNSGPLNGQIVTFFTGNVNSTANMAAIFEYNPGTQPRTYKALQTFTATGLPATFNVLGTTNATFSMYTAFNDHVSWANNPTLIGTDATGVSGLAQLGGFAWSCSVLGSNPTIGMALTYGSYF